LLSTVSAIALIVEKPILMSFAQYGIVVGHQASSRTKLGEVFQSHHTLISTRLHEVLASRVARRSLLRERAAVHRKQPNSTSHHRSPAPPQRRPHHLGAQRIEITA
jgi:hypothetical protein